MFRRKKKIFKVGTASYLADEVSYMVIVNRQFNPQVCIGMKCGSVNTYDVKDADSFYEDAVNLWRDALGI